MKLIIIGAGKYGKEIEDIAEQTEQFETIAFLDDKVPNVLGKCEDCLKFINEDTSFYVAFGNNELREKWCRMLLNRGAKLENLIHPTAYVSPKAKLGVGIAVLPNTTINSYTVIRDGCIINSGAIVDHDCTVAPYAHICVGAIVKADNHIPAKMKVEAGVVIERETYKGE